MERAVPMSGSAIEPPSISVDDEPYVRVSWAGLLYILDTVYPVDVFDGSSGDIGPAILVHLRAIEELRRA
jgi:hypothetical protein